MSGALKKYEELKNSDISNARSLAEKFLVNYLRQNPQACSDMVNLLDQDPKRERFDQSTQLILWRLLTEAQQAVIGAVTDPKYSDLTHIRAVAYVHDFENPEPFLAQHALGSAQTSACGFRKSECERNQSHVAVCYSIPTSFVEK